ncbi:hypothetical protein [Streptoalloteichus hindustanus]|uniref:Uncharacterized protein n=1 Tax=Streptoalloteichus hindustanus TaxID=2017 RepID=A0A1M5F6I9_STRHI|nr:hypothetical protein [Streptoalloteichus hindustanus]SHF87008.1 hypothetical protein SAMN05444320_105290 [Streptoalloteichus hindustanus]
MSLTVDVFVLDENDEMRLLDLPPACSDLAGFEDWRTLVWGSERVRALGARYFPVLADGDLVAPEQVRDFRRECALLAANLDAIAPPPEPGWSHERLVDGISFRLANITDAAERAEDVGGGVLVW